MLHEVGHIVRAHLDFLNSEFGFGDKLFMENSTSRKGDAEDKVRMYLEWDADRYAIMRLVDFAFTRREIAGTANSDNESKLSRVLLSISLALHCLDIEAKNRNRSTHLIPRDRAMVALSSTIEYMKKAKLKFDLKEVKDVFVRVSAEIEHLFQSTGLLFENSDRKSEFDSLGSLIDFTKDAIRHLEANLVPFIQGRIVRLGKSPKDFEL